ncbi:Hypothetical protein NTJ_06692 [Nesidiocoris tenuis]|uniref:Uncharacterized protein n=1 Tax=Nesidiocoris tenuis TaxID=355587 RepID=A0ABN7ANT3_9HEMI|nr:Hypothetical protein NTJ_06692 [Nesidiocoris tenuis]
MGAAFIQNPAASKYFFYTAKSQYENPSGAEKRGYLIRDSVGFNIIQLGAAHLTLTEDVQQGYRFPQKLPSPQEIYITFKAPSSVPPREVFYTNFCTT